MLQNYQSSEALTKLKLWLCCFASNSAINHYLCGHCNNHLATIATLIYDKETNLPYIKEETLQNAMQKLLPEQRHVINLKIVNGFSNRDVANILSKSVGAVKAIQNRALITLLHLLFSDGTPLSQESNLGSAPKPLLLQACA